MRPLYIDVNGTLDASGNASIPVALPRMTGRWHNAKFALGTSGAAEWSILVNGRPYTHGRGRRVTLGPELIQDGETATVSVIGGPATATVDGTVTGVSGMPDEIMAAYNPAPNTIALDTAQGQILLGTITTPGDSAPHSKTFPIPTGSIQAVGLVIVASGFASPASATIKGDITGNTYLTWPVVGGFLADVERWFLPDANAICTVTDAGSASRVNFYAFNFGPVTTVRAGRNPLDVTSQNASPAFWQVPQSSAVFNGDAFGAGVTIHKVAGVAGQGIYVFDYRLVFDSANVCEALLQDTIGERIDAGFCTTAGAIALQGNAGGRVMAGGAGLDLVQQSGAAAGNIWGHIHYTQG